MAIRTVRLDDEAEATLRQIQEATGMRISEALQKGLDSLKQEIQQSRPRRAWEVYQQLDLGPGGYSIAPANEVRRGVKLALEKKFGKRRQAQ